MFFSPNPTYLIGSRKPWRRICNRKVRRHSLTLTVKLFGELARPACWFRRHAEANFRRGARRTHFDLEVAFDRPPILLVTMEKSDNTSATAGLSLKPAKQSSALSSHFFATMERFIPSSH